MITKEYKQRCWLIKIIRLCEEEKKNENLVVQPTACIKSEQITDYSFNLLIWRFHQNTWKYLFNVYEVLQYFYWSAIQPRVRNSWKAWLKHFWKERLKNIWKAGFEKNIWKAGFKKCLKGRVWQISERQGLKNIRKARTEKSPKDRVSKISEWQDWQIFKRKGWMKKLPLALGGRVVNCLVGAQAPPPGCLWSCQIWITKSQRAHWAQTFEPLALCACLTSALQSAPRMYLWCMWQTDIHGHGLQFSIIRWTWIGLWFGLGLSLGLGSRLGLGLTGTFPSGPAARRQAAANSLSSKGLSIWKLSQRWKLCWWWWWWLEYWWWWWSWRGEGSYPDAAKLI